MKTRIGGDPDFLCAKEADLVEEHELAFDRTLFPDDVSLGNAVLKLEYAYTPGDERDGVTVKVPLLVAQTLSEAQIFWMVPGLREEQIGVLLRALPKAVRRSLHPLDPKVREVVEHFQPESGAFLPALAKFLTRRFAVPVQASDWADQRLPDHLRPRVEVVDEKNQTVAVGRDLPEIHAAVELSPVRSDAWTDAVRQWERPNILTWEFGDLPESLRVEEIAGATVFAYPGLVREAEAVAVRLFRKSDEAVSASVVGFARLAELNLSRDLAWLDKEVATLARPPKNAPSRGLGALAAWSVQAPTEASWGRPGVVRLSAIRHITAAILPLDPVMPLTQKRFADHLAAVRRELPLMVRKVSDIFEQIRTLRENILASPKRYPGLDHDLLRLVPEDFLDHTPYAQLGHLPRFLRAVQIRAERAASNPARDPEKARQLAPFVSANPSGTRREEFRWLLEEFRVSLFAQELGTAVPVSARRLEALLIAVPVIHE